ncbi:Uncharacterized protein conserved in bacteria [Yersinia frederiksenii]|nr:Uncharacterized protein conserved in bacteria [Yersinia frederiksenii]
MDTPLNWHKDHFIITTDPSQLDIDAIHRYLTRSSWAAGINKETVRASITHSLCFGLFDHHNQIGFARLITDFTTFGYLCDVYVIEEYQKSGLGLWLIECCQSHPIVSRLRRVMLVTTTAPWLYEKVGYQPVNIPDYVWQITRPDIYKVS